MKFEGNQVNIPIKGIMRAGTDELCADGAMNEVIGMEYKDGSWLPYVMTNEGVVFTDVSLDGGIKKVYVHKTSDGESHYIVISTNNSLFYEVDRIGSDKRISLSLLTDSVKDIEFIGNMLCVSKESGMEYYLWKENRYESSYAHFSPSDDISLRVTAGYKYDGFLLAGMRYGTKLIDAEKTLNESKWIYDKRDTIISTMIAAMGENRDRGGLSGYVIGCAAYRLKNGELIQATPPVLLSKPLDPYSSQGSSSESAYSKETYFSGQDELSEDFTCIDGSSKKVYSIFPTGQGPQRSEAYAIFEGEIVSVSANPYYNIYMDDGVQEIRHNDTNCACGYGSLILQCVESRPGYTNIGDPIIQNSNVYAPPVLSTILCDKELSTSNERRWIYNAYVAGNGLQFKVNNAEHLSALKEIGVSSVCFFLSQEVVPFVVKEKEVDYDKMFNASYGLFDIWNPWNPDNPIGTGKMGVSFGVKRKSVEEITKELSQLQSLYLVQETQIDKVLENDDWEYIDLNGKLGDNLVVREQLPLTAFDYTKTYSGKLSAYNYRLHQFDYKQELFAGYPLPSFGYHGGFGQYPEEYFTPHQSQYLKWEAKVVIKNEDGETRITTFDNNELGSLIKTLSPIITYPDKNAESITIAQYFYPNLNAKREKTFYFSHDSGLGIAYYIDPELKPIVIDLVEEAPPSSDLPSKDYQPYNTERYYHNGLKVSDVAYPSYFPAKYTYRIGNEKIIGLARLTIPVSQDNYGVDRLIVFCSDGIYSMGVDRTGAGVYTDTQYVDPEVCVNKNTICEIGGAIIFASDKGLMMLSSNGVEEFTPHLNGKIQFKPSDSAVSIKDGYHIYNKIVTHDEIVELKDSLSTEDFIDYIGNTDTVVSYVSNKNKIVIYNKFKPYIYLIDIKTRNITKLDVCIDFDDDNSPEETYWVYNGGEWSPIVFGYLSDAKETDCLIQSRPIKIQQDDKCSYRCVLTGYFEGNANSTKWAELVVLGSLDGDHWRAIGVKERKLNEPFHNFGCITERGSWKYIMFIFAGRLNSNSHIDSIDITVEGKYNNKKR